MCEGTVTIVHGTVHRIGLRLWTPVDEFSQSLTDGYHLSAKGPASTIGDPMKRRTAVLVLVVAVLALAASSVASADSIIDQYTEGVPSAGGSGSSGGSGGSGSYSYDSSALSA